MRHITLIVCVMCLARIGSAAVVIDSARLAAEMKYWLCSADGETADVLLHVNAEQTIKESLAKKGAAVNCATFASMTKAVEAAVASRKWMPATKDDGSPAGAWQGCRDAKCVGSGKPLKLTEPTYVRMLEFGHEQAKGCKGGANQAIDAFVANLLAQGCSSRVCTISDYIKARPNDGKICSAI